MRALVRRTRADSRSGASDRIIVFGVAVLTFAIVGPLLRPGTVLLLDWVPAPRPELSSQFWGFPPGPPNGAPVEVIRWLFDHIVPWGFGKLLPLAIAPALAAWGLRRLLRPVTDSALVVLASTTFMIVNPFMYDRMLAGHLYLIDGVALMPLLLSFLKDEPGLRTAVNIGLSFATLVALSLHFVFIAGILLVSYALAAVIVGERRRALTATIGAAATVALSQYWIIPAVVGITPPLGLSSAHVDAFKTTTDRTYGLLPNVLGLYGFWRSEWPLSKSNFPIWPLLLVVILLVVAVGFLDLMRRPQLRVVALSLVIGSIVGVLLSLGTQGPTGWLFRLLFEQVPGFAAMRESQKFLALLVIGYSSMFGWGVKVLAEQATTQRAAIGVVALLTLLPLIYGYKELWGFNGFIRPSRYPVSWTDVDRLMGKGEGRVLALPWHQYLSIPFAGGRILSDPAESFFTRETIVSDDPEVPGISSAAPDTLHAYIDKHVRSRDHTGFERAIAAAGVEYVLLRKYVDYQSYGWLTKRSDLTKVRETNDLVLYRNDVYLGALGSVDGARIRLKERSAVRFDVLDASRGGPLRAALIPADGWQYGGVRSRADGGVTAVFDASVVSRGAIRFVPWRATWVAYVIEVVLLILSLFVFRRSVRRPYE